MLSSFCPAGCFLCPCHALYPFLSRCFCRRINTKIDCIVLFKDCFILILLIQCRNLSTRWFQIATNPFLFAEIIDELVVGTITPYLKRAVLFKVTPSIRSLSARKVREMPFLNAERLDNIEESLVTVCNVDWMTVVWFSIEKVISFPSGHVLYCHTFETRLARISVSKLILRKANRQKRRFPKSHLFQL